MDLLNSGVNIIAYRKNNCNYGMTFAWGMMVDYDTIVCLLGSQSITGNNLAVNDIVGISALSQDQGDIALNFGEGHSHEKNKFENIAFTLDKSAILIDNSRNMIVGQVLKIDHFPSESKDNLVFIKVLSKKENPSKKFMSFAEFSGE